MTAYQDHNRAAWNRMVDRGTPFAKVASDEECQKPLEVLDSRGWLPKSVAGLDVLCLAAGGGWQSILYAAAGARVTVVDISAAMLRQDQREAAKRNFSVTTHEGSMDNLSMLRDESFDIVHQPVSTCYVPKIAAVYQEVARVLRDDGLYISQHKQPGNLQVAQHTPDFRYILGIDYYHAGPLPNVEDVSYREQGTLEYLHRWEQLVGDLCRAGFVLEDLREPYRADPSAPPGHYKHRSRFVPPYVRMKARRRPRVDNQSTESPRRLWTPG